jgi:predicted trehalose synthase
LASAEAFGRGSFALGDWMDGLELGPADEQLAKTIEVLRAEGLRPGAIRTQGDFHLGRLARTDHGWVVSDFSVPARGGGVGVPIERSPLGDVADLVWSLSLAANHAAAERDRAGDGELAELAASWEARNRRSVLDGYFETPGIAELVGLDSARAGDVIGLYELARANALR